MDHTQTMEMNHKMLHGSEAKSESPYRNLFLVSIVHFVIMYAVMYTMVYSSKEIFLNLNNLYMTGMMLAPMVVLMPLMMKMMYPNRKLNALILTVSAVVFVAFYAFMRSQAFIGDKQFLRSMIPHHSGAILMCEQSSLLNPEIRTLCGQIIESQKKEIDQMKQILSRM